MFPPEELVLEKVKAALSCGEFRYIDSLVEQLRCHESIPEVWSGWLVYGGLARYFLGNFNGALSDYRQAAASDPSNSSALANLAYLLACCPDKTLHDADSAIVLATRACEITDWKIWTNILTLAAAYARKQNFKLAEEYANTAMKMAPAGSIWRCERLLGKIRNRQAFTGNLEDDLGRLRSDL